MVEVLYHILFLNFLIYLLNSNSISRDYVDFRVSFGIGVDEFDYLRVFMDNQHGIFWYYASTSLASSKLLD